MANEQMEKLVFELEARLDKFEQGMKKAEKSLKDLGKAHENVKRAADTFFEKMGQDLPGIDRFRRAVTNLLGPMAGTAAGAGRAAATLGILGVGVAAVAGSMIAGAVKAARWADNLQDLAVQTGISAEKIQVLRFMSVDAGMAAGDMDTAIVRLTRSIGDAREGQGELAELMRKYRINVTDAKGETRNAADVLRDIAERIKNAKSASEAMNLSVAAFGRQAGPKMVVALKEGAAAFDKAEKKARAFGVVLDKDMVKKAAEASDELDKVWFITKTRGLAAFAELSGLVVGLAHAFGFLAEKIGIVVGDLARLIGLLGTTPQDIVSGLQRQAKSIEEQLGPGGLFRPGGIFDEKDRAEVEKRLERLRVQIRLGQKLIGGDDGKPKIRPGGGLPPDKKAEDAIANALDKAADAVELAKLRVQFQKQLSEEALIELRYQEQLRAVENDKVKLSETQKQLLLQRVAALVRVEAQEQKIKDLNKLDDELKIAQAELETLRMGAVERETKLKMLRLELEYKQRGQEIDEKTRAQMQARIEAIAKTTEETRKLKEALDFVADKLASFSDSLFDALTKPLEEGEKAADRWRKIMRTVLNDVAKMMFQLAVTNPLRNLITGRNDAPTLSGIGGLLARLFGGGLSDTAGAHESFQAGRASGGDVEPGYLYPVGERGQTEYFAPGTRGRILTTERVGGGTVINQYWAPNFTTGVQATVRAEIMQMKPIFMQWGRDGTMQGVRQGGRDAQVMGAR